MDPTSREELLQLQLWDIEEKEADRQGLTSYPCPCKKCMGVRILDRKTTANIYGSTSEIVMQIFRFFGPKWNVSEKTIVFEPLKWKLVGMYKAIGWQFRM